MPIEDKMTIDERRKYLRMMHKRYVDAPRKGRSRLLDEMEAVTGMHRKALIRLMKGPLARKGRVKQRGKGYGPEVDECLAYHRRKPGLALCRAADAHFELDGRAVGGPR